MPCSAPQRCKRTRFDPKRNSFQNKLADFDCDIAQFDHAVNLKPTSRIISNTKTAIKTIDSDTATALSDGINV